MEKLLLPSNFKMEETGKVNEARIIIEPCFHGYGTTLGNALRRVLFSSLPGAAVIAVKIKGAAHEFMALEHVQEDVVEILLNLKQLRLRVFSIEPVKLSLEANGEGEVTAAQINVTSDVEIINPDLHIAALTHKNAKLEMEIIVAQGRGYVSVEEKDKKKLDIGTIAINSIFTPVINVGYQVEFMRVGEITNFERLIFTIETDGTLNPVNALIQASEILVDHFNLVLKEFGGRSEVAKEIEALEKNETMGEITAAEFAAEKIEEKKEEAKAKKPAKRGRPKGSVKKK